MSAVSTMCEDRFDLRFVSLLELDNGPSRECGEHCGDAPRGTQASEELVSSELPAVLLLKHYKY